MFESQNIKTVIFRFVLMNKGRIENKQKRISCFSIAYNNARKKGLSVKLYKLILWLTIFPTYEFHTQLIQNCMDLEWEKSP